MALRLTVFLRSYWSLTGVLLGSYLLTLHELQTGLAEAKPLPVISFHSAQSGSVGLPTTPSPYSLNSHQRRMSRLVCSRLNHMNPALGNACTTTFPSASAPLRHPSTGAAYGYGHESGSIC